MVELRIILIMFDILKLRYDFIQICNFIFRFESTFYQCTPCTSTDVEIVSTFLHMIGPVAHL